MNFLLELVNAIDNLFKVSLGTELFDKSATLVYEYAPVFGIALSIYMIFLVAQYYKSGFDDVAVTMSKQVVGLLIITALAFNVQMYTELAKVIYQLPDELASVIVGSSLDKSVIRSSFDTVIKIAMSLINWGSEQIGFTEIVIPLVSILGGILVGFLGSVNLFVLWFYYLVTKLSLALVLLFGPIFLGSMMFPSTRQYGMNWIGQCLNFCLSVAMFAAISTIQLTWIKGKLTQLSNSSVTAEIGGIADVFFIVVFFAVFVILSVIIATNVPNIVAALTGGATAESGVRKLAAMANPALKVLNAIKKGK